jgi:hypothetical protein
MGTAFLADYIDSFFAPGKNFDVTPAALQSAWLLPQYYGKIFY